MNRSDIVQNLLSFLSPREEIIFAVLHGSFIKTDRFNDIDIALYLNEIDSVLQYELNMETEVILAGILPREPDIRVLNNSPLYFQYNVIKEGNLLFSKNENAYADFKENIIRNYFDFQPHYKQLIKESLNIEV